MVYWGKACLGWYMGWGAGLAQVGAEYPMGPAHWGCWGRVQELGPPQGRVWGPP